MRAATSMLVAIVLVAAGAYAVAAGVERALAR